MAFRFVCNANKQTTNLSRDSMTSSKPSLRSIDRRERHEKSFESKAATLRKRCDSLKANGLQDKFYKNYCKDSSYCSFTPKKGCFSRNVDPENLRFRKEMIKKLENSNSKVQQATSECQLGKANSSIEKEINTCLLPIIQELETKIDHQTSNKSDENICENLKECGVLINELAKKWEVLQTSVSKHSRKCGEKLRRPQTAIGIPSSITKINPKQQLIVTIEKLY